jgi:eukaryotic-like serine/threonine-protein kinase
MLARSNPKLVKNASSAEPEEPATKRIDRLLADQKECWRRNERVSVETYLLAHPWLSSDREAVLDLIFQEIVLREQSGETPAIEEYSNRFPDLAQLLKMQFEIDRVLQTELTESLSDGSSERNALLAETEVVASSAEPPVGEPDSETVDLIPGYKRIRELGRGGMGVVYLVWQSSLHRPVALKMILSGAHAGDKDLARFRTEAEAIARLNHPNIVQVHEVGWEQSRPYMALEFVDGGSLASRLKGEPQPAREAAQLVETLSRAVHYAHQHGIVHRDLSPGNVLLTVDGVPKIGDFGLAKLVDGSEPTATQTGDIFGTPCYMAPEQIGSKTGAIGPSADVYALGAILYQLITGHVPFKAATAMEVLLLVQTADPIPPRRWQPTLSLDLATIAMKCLEKEPSKRYSSALALAEDLGRFLAGEPILARPIRTPERVWRLCRRNPVFATLIATVVTLFIATTVITLLKNSQLATALTSSETAKEQARGAAAQLGQEQKATLRELQRAQIAEEHEKHELFDALVAQARANRLSRQIGQRFRSLETLQQAMKIASERESTAEKRLELRNEAIAALALPDMRVAQEWMEGPGTCFDFDPTLERYAHVDDKGDVHVRLVADRKQLYLLPGFGEGVGFLQFSDDGRFLMLYHGPSEQFAIWKLDAEKADQVLRDRRRLDSSPCFSPDSRRAAIQDPDGSIGLFDLDNRKYVGRLPVIPTAHFLIFDPSGRRLGIAVDGGAQVRDAKSGKLIWEKSKLPAGWPNLKWHPDGKLLAVADDEVVNLWDLAKPKPIGSVSSWPGIAIAFNRTGTLMATHSWNGKFHLWDALTTRELFSTPADIVANRFSRDGRFFAADADGDKVRTWEVADGGEYRTLTGDPSRGRSAFQSCAVSADGSIIVGGREGGAVIWDAMSGRESAFLGVSWGRTFVSWGLPVKSPWWRMSSSDSGSGKRDEETLLMMGKDGLFRYHVARNVGSRSIKVTKSEKLPIPGYVKECAQSADGGVIAAAQLSGAVLWHADPPERLITLDEDADVRYVAVSPNGQWVALGRHHDPGGATIWDARTGALKKELPVGRFCHVVFSPDGRYLLTSSGIASDHNGVVRRWDVETWNEVPFAEPVPGIRPAFSCDGRVLVVESGTGKARLLNAATGKELASLEDPNQHRAEYFAFTPDRTKLVAASPEGFCVHVWDLKAIRRELAALGLNWEDP